MFANDHTDPGATPALRFPWETPPGHDGVIEVAEGILWIRSPLPFRLDHVNLYALDEGDHWTLIDTGANSSKSRAAWEALLAGPLAGKPVGRVVITHHHPDHIGLMGWFADQGAEMWATRLGYALGRMMQLDQAQGAKSQPPEAVAFRRLAGQDADGLAAYAADTPFKWNIHPIPLGVRVIEDGQVLRMGGRDWTVHFGHGHAWDHATFWTEGLVLAGDQIIPGISSNVGVWALEPEGDTVGAWFESCARLARLADGADPLVLPGHKLPFKGIGFRLAQLIQNHHGAIARILDDLSGGPKSAAEMFRPIFGRSIHGSQYGLAIAEAVAHMNHMYLSGQVDRRAIDGVWVYALKDTQTPG